MARPQLLNSIGAAAEMEPVALSRALLSEARSLSDADECRRLDQFGSQLHDVKPAEIAGDQARIAFWVNLYNALVLHCLCLKPLQGSLLWHLRLFDRVAYRVGGHDYPLNVIENGVLRVNRRPPLRPRPPLRDSDPRLGSAPSELDPRVHFALNCGARSCPPINSYDSDELDAQLELATASYLRQETRVDADRGRAVLPRLLRMYRQDFGDRRARLEFVAARVPELRELLVSRRGVRARYAPFDWTVAQSGRAGAVANSPSGSV